MATIALNSVLTATHLNRTFRASVQITQSVERAWSYTQAIGTSEEVITIPGDITTLGIAWFTNKDATNYVDVGPEVTGALEEAFRLKAGESFPIRLVPGLTYRAKANTSPVDLDITVFAD